MLAFYIYRRWRTRKLKCPVCGTGMKRLPEDKDNLLLTDSQDFEEKIRTVDYDVWECPRCGAVERCVVESAGVARTESYHEVRAESAAQPGTFTDILLTEEGRSPADRA